MFQLHTPPKVAGTADVSFQTIYSTHMQVYRIPLSYAFTDNLKMELTVPYVRKHLKGEYTGEELTARGIGDISVGAKYRYGDLSKIQWMTSFYVKLPTGDEKQFKDRREQLALGTGSYDFAVNQSMTGFYRNMMFVASVGYSFNTKNDYTETSNFGTLVKYESEEAMYSTTWSVWIITPLCRVL